MQRLRWSASRCGRRNLANTLSRLSSSSTGSEHDDFWTAAQTEAKTTPAYQQAAQASTDTPSSSADRDKWAIPGGFGRGRMPLGDAYGPFSTTVEENNSGPPPFTPSTNTFNQGERRSLEPVFDMLSSMHLSPVKQVDVRTFKGTTLVDIRQYFKSDGGDTLPTKKGIALTIPQWRLLQAAMEDIDRKIQAMSPPGSDLYQDGEQGPGGRAT